MRVCSFLITAALLTIMLPFNASHAESDWDAWNYRMPITLTHRTADNAGLVPVDVTFSLFADRLTNPENEIRLILKDGSSEKEIPFQLSRLSNWTKNTDGVRSKASLNGRITFFDEAKGRGNAEYIILYGNPDAKKPDYPSDLKVSGTAPSLTIENSKMTVQLHSSGQLGSVTLKNNTSTPISTERGILHWNPGVFIPTVHWAHAFDWNPPEVFEIEEGPLYVEIRRSGVFPKIRDVHLAITYRFFKERSYVESGTQLRVLDDIGVVALRNDELIFSEHFFSHVAWNDNGQTMSGKMSDYEPVNKHGDILRISDSAPFVTLYNPETRIGAATIRMELAKLGPNGDPPVLFDNATYISNGHALQYWFRPMIYFHVGWDRKQLITVPEGSLYAERNLYLFHNGVVSDVEALSQAVNSKPSVEIGEYGLPPER